MDPNNVLCLYCCQLATISQLTQLMMATGSQLPLMVDRSVGRSVELLLALASTVIPGFSLLDIHGQDFYSLLDMYMFRNGAFFSM
jgi:hypothetical protein